MYRYSNACTGTRKKMIVASMLLIFLNFFIQITVPTLSDPDLDLDLYRYLRFYIKLQSERKESHR